MIIPYGKQNIDRSDIKNVVKCLKSDFLTQGPIVQEFENSLKKNFKAKFATVVSNGSAALLLIGKILNWKKGDKIAVPPITFVSSVNSIEHLNAKPLFIDINLSDYCMDPDKLEEALKKDKKKKIKAAIITDYGGQPAQWKKFSYLKKKYNITLVNDNCHAIGSTMFRDKGYACKYADLVSLSFHPVKTITSAEGGAILTNNKYFAEKTKLLRSHGIERDKKKYWKYKVNYLGYNFRLPDLNCALGLSQLSRLTKFVKKRQKIAKVYDDFFKNINDISTPKKFLDRQNSYHLYPILINKSLLKNGKDEVIKKFFKNKIKVQVHYIPVNTQPYFRKKYKFNKKNFKNSMLFFKSAISLPIYYDLNLIQINYIKKICKKIFINK